MEKFLPHGSGESPLAEEGCNRLSADPLGASLHPIDFLNCLSKGHHDRSIGWGRIWRLGPQEFIHQRLDAELIRYPFGNLLHFLKDKVQFGFGQDSAIEVEDVLSRDCVYILHVCIFFQ